MSHWQRKGKTKNNWLGRSPCRADGQEEKRVPKMRIMEGKGKQKTEGHGERGVACYPQHRVVRAPGGIGPRGEEPKSWLQEPANSRRKKRKLGKRGKKRKKKEKMLKPIKKKKRIEVLSRREKVRQKLSTASTGSI